ncbi:MAG: polyprenyl synthetase family protein, partial [Candidatus Nealsonbacteria bacterium]
MKNNFEKSFSSYQKEFNKEIKIFFDNKIKNTKEKFLRSCLLSLKEYSLRPAKRIRAVLVNQGYLLAGGKERKKILKTSIFIELIHNFLLIHDDVMDRDKKRRNKPTMQYKYGGGHHGDSMAITMGDLINSLGYELLNSSPFSVDLKNEAIDKLNKTIYLTSYGQALELCLIKNKKISKKDIFEIYKNKTANYTFIAPLQIGAILAGANKLLLREI